MTSVQDFEGRAGIVTGAGSGIGRAVSLELAARGAHVLAVDLDEEGAVGTADAASKLPGSIHPHQADVSDAEQVAAMATRLRDDFDRPYFFHNNAGVGGTHASIVDMDPAAWRRVVDINLNSYFYGLHFVLPVLIEAGEGSVLITGSLLSLKGAPNRSDYTATKHAVLGLTRAAAAEVGTAGVRVNCICPGPIETPLQSESERLVSSDPTAERRRLSEATPLGRYGSTEEVARTAAFLLSPDVPYLTGAALTLDGGLSAV